MWMYFANVNHDSKIQKTDRSKFYDYVFLLLSDFTLQILAYFMHQIVNS